MRSIRSEIGYGMRRQAIELADIEREIDKVLQAQRGRNAAGEQNALDVTTLNVAAHRLQEADPRSPDTARRAARVKNPRA